MLESFAITTDAARGCVVFDEPTNAVWWATPTGELRSLRLSDRREVLHGSGFVHVAGISLGEDGLCVWVVRSNGDVYQALRSSADKTAASVKSLPRPDAPAPVYPMPDARRKRPSPTDPLATTSGIRNAIRQVALFTDLRHLWPSVGDREL